MRDCLATLLGVWVDRVGPNPQPLRPNILFILTDDLDIEGAQYMTEPQRLIGAQGMRFDAHYVSDLMQQHEAGTQNHSHTLWALMVYHLWRDNFARRARIDEGAVCTGT